jgi:hypothetical protein
VVYSLFSYHQKKNLGDPGSNRGMLEHIRVGLTLYMHLHGRGEGANHLFLALHPLQKPVPEPILCQNRV